MSEASNPQIRLMQAVRYARVMGGTDRDIRELVEAALEEPNPETMFPNAKGVVAK